MRALLLAGVAVAAACSPRPAPVAEAASEGRLTVQGSEFRLTAGDGEVLRSKDLVGAVFDMRTDDGTTARVRIDGVEPAAENKAVLLHRMTVVDQPGGERPLCGADPQGRHAAIPIQGRFDETGAFVADETEWLLTCSLGTNGKCLLWGYDPWGKGRDGRSLKPYYEACQRLARADYEGVGEPHTKAGTEIDVWDDIGVQKPTGDPKFTFEAGWGPKGATCVVQTRWPDLLDIETLHARAPRLAARCDEAGARSQGAILFTAVKRKTA